MTDAPPTEDFDALLQAVGRLRDREAFASLFRHFAPRVKSYLLKLGDDGRQAEELTQEIMLLVWRRAETFDPRLARASSWIYAIARNRRIDAYRRERRPEIDPDDPALVPDPVDSADRMVERGQDAARLASAVASLPPEQAELLRMAFYENKAHGAIAAERGLPLGTVKSRLRLALTRLRKAMGERA